MAPRVHRPLENQEFDFVVGMARGPVLAYFVGSWPKAVGAAKVMDGLVADLAEEYGARLTAVRADITRCPAPVRRYEVTGSPTVVLLHGGGEPGEARAGEELARHEGPLTHEEFRAFLEPHL
ncbi:thioredoxin family protein [Streptomyces sp. NBC_00249]|uniref:thioredoxin family protein n=1 Tax=Streptomyces sp. NBC_00249 TaxID=2975690 RepID=UPI0022585F41|nr:thioredoxin family protein [Streptomyces sp. NBC_00249]MCX5195174.1 thioredoxin family protein [Streptomyces sp. NBC_00249]